MYGKYSQNDKFLTVRLEIYNKYMYAVVQLQMCT